MKILQIIQKKQLRGAEVFASQLSEHLLELGHECKMVALFGGVEELPFSGTLIHLDRPPGKRLYDWSGWKALTSIVVRERPDIVQANAGDTLKFAVLSKFFFGWKAPIVFRNASKVSDYIDTWPKLVLNRFLVSRVNHIVSVSELCCQDFIQVYSVPDKTSMVPIGIEMDPVNTSLPPDLKSIFAGSRVLLHVASFVPEKNHAGLLRITERLLEKDINIKVVMIGDGKLRQFIEQEIVNRKLADRVFLLGYRKDVLSIMANADVFILPSKIEGLPGVVLEAMYSRVPVVAYNVGGISEVVRQGETGWLVKADDEAAFVNAVEEVLHAPNLTVIKDNAYTLVAKEYDNRTTAKKFLDLYQKVVDASLSSQPRLSQ